MAKKTAHTKYASGMPLDNQDPATRRAKAEQALEGHPHKARILRCVDFREPTSRDLETAKSLKDRARKALAGHGAAA